MVLILASREGCWQREELLGRHGEGWKAYREVWSLISGRRGTGWSFEVASGEVG